MKEKNETFSAMPAVMEVKEAIRRLFEDSYKEKPYKVVINKGINKGGTETIRTSSIEAAQNLFDQAKGVAIFSDYTHNPVKIRGYKYRV